MQPMFMIAVTLVITICLPCTADTKAKKKKELQAQPLSEPKRDRNVKPLI